MDDLSSQFFPRNKASPSGKTLGLFMHEKMPRCGILT